MTNRGTYPQGSLRYGHGKRRTKRQEEQQAEQERREKAQQAEREALAAWIIENMTDEIEKLRKEKP